MNKKTTTDNNTNSAPKRKKQHDSQDPFAPGAPSPDAERAPDASDSTTTATSAAKTGESDIKTIDKDTSSTNKTATISSKSERQAKETAPAFGTAKKKTGKKKWLLLVPVILAGGAALGLPYAEKKGIPGAAALAQALPPSITSALGISTATPPADVPLTDTTATAHTTQPDDKATMSAASDIDTSSDTAPIEDSLNDNTSAYVVSVAPVSHNSAPTPMKVTTTADSIAGLQAELDAARATAGAEREASQRYIASLETSLRKKEAALYALQSGREEAEILREGAQLLVKDIAELYTHENLLRDYLAIPEDPERERALLARLVDAFPEIAEKIQSSVQDAPSHQTMLDEVRRLESQVNAKATAALTWDFLPDKLAKLLSAWLTIRKDDPNPMTPIAQAVQDGNIQTAALLAQDVSPNIDGAEDMARRLNIYADIQATAGRILDLTEKKLSGKLSGL